MRTTVLTILILLLLLASPAPAGSVVYQSDHAVASGYSESRLYGEQFFTLKPASLWFDYTYDAGIIGVVKGNTTTYAVPTLLMVLDVPGYFRTAVGAGTVAWTGDTIRFRGDFLTYAGAPPDGTIIATFARGDLTPGLLPASLAGLEGITGTFSADATATFYSHGDGGSVGGTAVSAPEPSAFVLLILGMAGLAWLRKRSC